MTRSPLTVVFAALFTSAAALAASPDEALVGKISDARLSMLDGIAQVEKTNGPAISAKFELKGDKLMLSIYTAKEGRENDAEHNTLMEHAGDSTAAAWAPSTEVFEDKAHIARSAMQLTLLQTTKLTLVELIKKAGAMQKGVVYSAIPVVKNGKAVVELLVATADKKSVALSLDPQTGKAVKP